jgi:hypothetical protein
LVSLLSLGNVNLEINLMLKLSNSRKRSDYFKKLILWIVYSL